MHPVVKSAYMPPLSRRDYDIFQLGQQSGVMAANLEFTKVPHGRELALLVEVPDFCLSDLVPRLLVVVPF